MSTSQIVIILVVTVAASLLKSVTGLDYSLVGAMARMVELSRYAPG